MLDITPVPGDATAAAELPPDCMSVVARWLDLPARLQLCRLSKTWHAVVHGLLAEETRLDLYRFRANIDDRGLTALARACPRLQAVNVCGCELLSDAALEALATYCHELRDVNLSCVRAFGFEAVRVLCSRCPLRDLHLAGCAIDPSLIRKHFSHLIDELVDEEDNMGSTD